MANIQFVDTVNRRHPLGVVIMQAVAGIDDKPFLAGIGHRIGNGFERGIFSLWRFGLGILSGVKFDYRRASTHCSINLGRVRINKQ